MSVRCSVICLTITEANKDSFGIIPEHFENDIVQPILYCDLVGTLPIQSLELLDTKERGLLSFAMSATVCRPSSWHFSWYWGHAALWPPSFQSFF